MQQAVQTEPSTGRYPSKGGTQMSRYLTILPVVALAALAIAAPASAAPPANDTFAGATTISSLPFNETLDTTQATTDADDDEAGACAVARPRTTASGIP